MAEREGTPEDFARLAAELRGQNHQTKREANRRTSTRSTRPSRSPSPTWRPRSSCAPVRPEAGTRRDHPPPAPRGMTVLRACVRCGRPSKGGYCPEHKPKPWATSKRRERMGLSGGRWDTLRRRSWPATWASATCATSSVPIKSTTWWRSLTAAPTTSPTWPPAMPPATTASTASRSGRRSVSSGL